MHVYRYVEKGCQKKVHATIPKGVVGVSLLFFKEIWKNVTRGHGGTFVSAKGKQLK